MIRYIEEPGKGKMVRRAEGYRWSNAAGHCGLIKDKVLTKKSDWSKKLEGIGDWREWLSEEEDKDKVEIIKRNTYKGLPTGTEEFEIKRFRPLFRLLINPSSQLLKMALEQAQ